MTLPSFLGIGAQRSGTSWLYEQLKNHPDIFMPERKEIHFFDKNYELGIDWYKNFFPDNKKSFSDRVCGEISPGYLYTNDAAQRILKYIPDCKIIAILRNPIDRCYSQYKYSVRNNSDQRSFIEFARQTDALSISLYSEQVKRFKTNFPTESFLCLIFEEVMSDPPNALKQIGNFIGVDSTKFLLEDSLKKVNSSYVFRFNHLFGMTRSYFKNLRKRGLYVEPITSLMKKIYFSLPENILYSKIDKSDYNDLDSQTYYDLFNQFEADINNLEVLLGRDLSLWKIKKDTFRN
jgi:hypothetical protein